MKRVLRHLSMWHKLYLLGAGFVVIAASVFMGGCTPAPRDPDRHYSGSIRHESYQDSNGRYRDRR